MIGYNEYYYLVSELHELENNFLKLKMIRRGKLRRFFIAT